MALLNHYILDILKWRYENVEISHFNNVQTNVLPSKKNILLSKKINFRILKRAIKFNYLCVSCKTYNYISVLPPLKLLFHNYDIITKKGFTKIYNFILDMSPCGNKFLLDDNCKNCVNHLMLLFSNIKNMRYRYHEFFKRGISLKFYDNCVLIFCRNCRYFTITRHLINMHSIPINISTLFVVKKICHEIGNIKTLKFIKKHAEEYEPNYA